MHSIDMCSMHANKLHVPIRNTMKNNLLQTTRRILCLAIFYVMAGEVTAQSPGGVSASLKMWTKANTGVVATGANVTQWTNQTGAGNATVGASTILP
jgi:hypothetical protein